MTASTKSNSIFEDQAHAWWDESGPFKPLHQMNPLRLEFITSHIKKHFNVDSLKGLTLLDVGCGGGLLCEPLARLGSTVTGIDLSHEAIQVAKSHAKTHHLTIDYRVADLKDLKNERFDVVIASEVIEHVDDPAEFMKDIAVVLKDQGCTIITTLNRTWKSRILGIYVAENILHWAPKGAHQHEKFIKPSELHAMMSDAGMSMDTLQGLVFNPLKWQWELSKDMGINYFAFGRKES